MSEGAEIGAGQTCFVVGPIGDRFALRGTPGRVAHEEALQMWEKVFEPACEALGLRAIRADKIAEPGEIPEQIFQHLRDAPVVVADVTGGNANVMYELGLRHTRDLITVQIGEHGRLPFDIASIRTLQFRRSEGGLVEVRDELIETLRSALGGRSSRVSATRVWNAPGEVDAASISAAVAVSREPDTDDEPDEPGFMDVLAEGETAVHGLGDVLGRATVSIVEVSDLVNEAGRQVAESDAGRGGFAGRLRVAKKLASDLHEPSATLEAVSGEFNSEVAKMDAMMQYLIARISDDPTEAAEAHSFVQSVIGMVDASQESEDGIRGMISGAVTMRKIARDLVPVSRTIERALNQFLKGIAAISAWRAPLVGAMEGHDQGEGAAEPRS